jgi:hypothetical protein
MTQAAGTEASTSQPDKHRRGVPWSACLAAGLLGAGDVDAKLELLLQNLGSDYEEFSSLNRYDTRAFVRVSLGFH